MIDIDGSGSSILEIRISSTVESGKLAQLSDDSLIYYANDGELGDAYLVKYTSIGSGQFSIDTTFDAAIEETVNADSDDYLAVDMSAIANSTGTPSVIVNDILATSEDEVFLVGEYSATNSYGFVGKYDGASGDYDSLFGQLTYPGFFIPAGDAKCDSLSATVTVDICDITTFTNIQEDAGTLYLHGFVTGYEGKTNIAILKMTETVNDSPTSYTVELPGA
jgi:hypothetical protein